MPTLILFRSTLATCALALLTFTSTQHAFGDASRFEKRQALLSYFGVMAEASYFDEIKYVDNTQTLQGFKTIARYIDPANTLAQYATIDTAKITVFQDKHTKQVVDFSLSFKAAGTTPSDPLSLLPAIKRIKFNRPESPLKGLRVAIDPGHMGGPFWDKETGKYVRVKDGRHVSEGELALYTALLLSRDLKEMGAEVLLTRTTLAPATTSTIEDFNFTFYANQELAASTDEPWFDELLDSAPLGPELFANAKKRKELRRLYSERKRGDYFTKRVDLQERAKKINEFNPHITLIIHYDSPDLVEHPPHDRAGFKITPLQTSINAVRTYIAGNAQPNEWASREARANLLRHLFDGHRWMESAVFSSALVSAVSNYTGIPMRKDGADEGAIKVGDGVYARNLALTRLINRGATSYIEVLYYNYKREFDALAKRAMRADIDGVQFTYSPRLDDIANGLRQGILDYVNPDAAKLPGPLF